MKPTMDEMRQHIIDLMLHSEWRGGVTSKELAKLWGCAPRTVADRALEASRIVREASKVEVQDFVAQALVELDSLAAEARALGKPREAAYCIELKAKMLGALAPVKRQEVPADGADMTALVKSILGDERVRAEVLQQLKGESKEEMH